MNSPKTFLLTVNPHPCWLSKQMNPHFTYEETKVYKGSRACLSSHAESLVKPGFEFWRLRACNLSTLLCSLSHTFSPLCCFFHRPRACWTVAKSIIQGVEIRPVASLSLPTPATSSSTWLLSDMELRYSSWNVIKKIKNAVYRLLLFGKLNCCSDSIWPFDTNI